MKRAAWPSDQSHDIQALVGSGLGDLTQSRFWLLAIRDATHARQWLASLLASGRVRSVNEVSAKEVERAGRIDDAVAVAFSHAGLDAMQLQPSKDFPFPTAFRSGMGSPLRERLLRDTDRSAWRWSDALDDGRGSDAPPAVHLLVANWWKTDTAPMPDPGAPAFDCVRSVQGCASFFTPAGTTEPFGFRDGLSQPIVQGLKTEDSGRARRDRDDAEEFYDDRIVAPGEFILGYRNEYDQLTYLPDMAGRSGAPMHKGDPGRFSRNGSYLAVRQIEQDVTAFEQLHLQTFPAPNGRGTVTLAEKVMGRYFDGKPLGWPDALNVPISDSKADAFRYRVEDAHGMVCPMGSHIRRVNPRDALGHDVQAGVRASKLHRLLRRGRPYREIDGDAEKQGLFFIACNADLERQFEFIHQRWLHNPRFAGLEDQDDPILGTARRLSLPGVPTGTCPPLAAYTRTRGGGYFFLPGIETLGFMAR